MSALGGMGVHAMSFAGPDILPEANPGGTEVWLEESNEVGQTPTNWISHPSGIGYRRSSPGIITTTGSGSSASTSQGPPLPGNAPSMDTGLSDGGTTAELNRLNNFNAGGNENPTAMQPGPVSRAEQIGEGPLRANLGNEMNVGGYVGYGLLQDLGLIPEHSDRSSLDPNHVDSSRSGRDRQGYGGGLASVTVSPPQAALEQGGESEISEASGLSPQAQRPTDPDEGARTRSVQQTGRRSTMLKWSGTRLLSWSTRAPSSESSST